MSKPITRVPPPALGPAAAPTGAATPSGAGGVASTNPPGRQPPRSPETTGGASTAASPDSFEGGAPSLGGFEQALAAIRTIAPNGSDCAQQLESVFGPNARFARDVELVTLNDAAVELSHSPTGRFLLDYIIGELLRIADEEISEADHQQFVEETGSRLTDDAYRTLLMNDVLEKAAIVAGHFQRRNNRSAAAEKSIQEGASRTRSLDPVWTKAQLSALVGESVHPQALRVLAANGGLDRLLPVHEGFAEQLGAAVVTTLERLRSGPIGRLGS